MGGNKKKTEEKEKPKSCDEAKRIKPFNHGSFK